MILQARPAWVAAVSFTAALLLASLRLRDCRWFPAQVSHRDWPGIAGLLQFRHRPSSLALSRFFCSWRRWYSFRSGCWLLTCSYSRRASLAVSGSLALVAGGLFLSPFGFGLGSFFLARLVCLVPARVLPGIGKVCWNKILLGESAGVDVGAGIGVGAAVAVDSGVFAGGGAVAAMVPGVGVTAVSGVGSGSEQAARVVRIIRMAVRRSLCTWGSSSWSSWASTIISSPSF